MKRARIAAASCGGAVVVMGVASWVSGLGGLGRLGGRPDVPTLLVSKAAFTRRVAAEGNLEAAEATPVIAPIDAQGQLKVAWLVPDGTPVKAGDVIVRFDPSEMERSLRDGQSDKTATESQITGMRAETGGAIRNLERDADLAREELKGADRFKVDDPDVFSRQEIIRSDIDRTLATQRIDTADQVRSIRQDVARVDLDLLDIERRKAGIAIDRASKGLDALEIKAPHDGILVYKRDWRGDITRVGDTVWPGEPVGEIPELDKMQARVFVLEADAGGLAEGLSATVTVEAHPALSYQAKIKKVDTLAKRRTGWIPVQYFGATLELDATDPKVMKPGQRVRAILALDARPDALSVPRNAIFEKDGKKVVYKLRGRAFAPVEVTLGPAAVGRVVVEQGLTEGDEIALSDPLAEAQDAQPRAMAGGSPTALTGAR